MCAFVGRALETPCYAKHHRAYALAFIPAVSRAFPAALTTTLNQPPSHSPQSHLQGNVVQLSLLRHLELRRADALLVKLELLPCVLTLVQRSGECLDSLKRLQLTQP